MAHLISVSLRGIFLYCQHLWFLFTVSAPVKTSSKSKAEAEVSAMGMWSRTAKRKKMHFTMDISVLESSFKDCGFQPLLNSS